jgi:hypothetical protein
VEIQKKERIVVGWNPELAYDDVETRCEERTVKDNSGICLGEKEFGKLVRSRVSVDRPPFKSLGVLRGARI